jgi:hypothetical protein
MPEQGQRCGCRPVRAALLVLAVLMVAGCGRAAREIPATPAEARHDPALTLERFAAAAHDRDVEGLWTLLSAPARTRLGPTLADFRRRAPEIERRVGSFTSADGYATILSEPLGDGVAAAAVARSAAAGREGPHAYAATLRLEGGSWRIELGGSLRLRALLPEPGRTARLPFPQLALEIRARKPIVASALWLDGVAFSAQSGGVNDHWITIWGRPGAPLEPGQHFVVGFAQTASDLAALAWSFDVG